MREPFTALHVHLVWATWDRLPLISAGVEQRIYSCIQAKSRQLGSEVVAIGGMEDHVHLLARVPASISIAHLVKHLKGSSSHLAGHPFHTEAFFKWQGGYGAFAVSRWDVHRVARYVNRQKDHHRDGSLSATLERIHE